MTMDARIRNGGGPMADPSSFHLHPNPPDVSMGKPRATTGAASLVLAVSAAFALIGCTGVAVGDDTHRRPLPAGETTVPSDAMPTKPSTAKVVDSPVNEDDQDCPGGICHLPVQSSGSDGDCYRPPAKRVVTPVQEATPAEVPAMADATSTANEVVVRIPSNITLSAWIVGLMAVATLGFVFLLLRNVKVSWKKGS